MAHEQRALQRQRQTLGEPSGFVFAVREHSQALKVGDQLRVGPTRQPALGAKRFQSFGLARDRAQHVERGDVSGPLPDRIDRRSAVDSGQPRVLDEAVAAQTLQCFGGMRRERACRSSTS